MSFSPRVSFGRRAKYSSAVTLCLGLAAPLCSAQAKPAKAAPATAKTSPIDGGGSDSSHYSPLTQITKENVSKLKVAWTYPTKDTSTYLFAPMVVGDRMYVLARNSSLVALDARTGKEIWVHEKLGGITGRGINYWESADGKDKRLVFTIHQQLQEIDATTGKSILTFGDKGFVDLRVGLGRPLSEVFRIQSNNPGKIYENLILLGSATGENYSAMPGDLRAYDVVTGKLAWQFHTIPHPGEAGYDSWPKDAYKYIGGANTWGEISIDTKTGTAFFPTSSAKYELYGGDRAGYNLYSDCLVAIDAKTGKLKWYYQLVHHDIWDWDNVSAPQLVTVKHNGKMVDAVAQAGKTGFLYVFDRTTGKPLWPIEEKPVPQSDFPGEKTAPTQPFPTVVPPFSRQTFTADDISPYILTDEERTNLKARVSKAKNGPLFTPPGQGDTISMPGNRGGSNWATTSANPSKGFVYVANYDSPAILHMTDEAPGSPKLIAKSSGKGDTGLELYSKNCAVCHGGARTGEIGPSLIDIDKRKDLAGIKATITNGQGQMPPFSGLGDATITKIAEYIFAPNLENVPMTGGVNGAQIAGFGGGARPAAAAPVELGGPVVASGGAPAGQDAPGAKLTGNPYGSMAGMPYPDYAPQVTRYYTNWNVMPTIVRPPWTTLVKYDLNTGKIAWTIPLGDDPTLAPQGITGTGIRQEQRGIIPTATGLVFVGTSDGYLRAFDDTNGKEIWKTEIPAYANRAIPKMYELDGKQYLVLDATVRVGTGNGSGAAGPGSPLPPLKPNAPPPAYVVYTLPDDVVAKKK